ncbi:tetratricopeptide repeat protein [Fibrella sp. HMF5335]|uniref:Tetratricopeptide repeat protein n=1 Tax=Fibrella rubiginis TaxID=2817060 RepID=A0A939K4W1_9BACT|nr:tetratricopeptide repeat protein [Fibrella rubiginis]MBO0938829.1 tetratricopeptide repeat protein [Fibrella rubiginis]
MRKPVLLALMAFISISTYAQKARSAVQALQFIKLANTLRALDKPREATALLLRAMPAVRGKDAYLEAVANELLGLTYHEQNNNASAIVYLEKARAQYGALKYVASAWGVNELVREISGKNVYAGVQIGTSSIKVAIFKTDYESDFYEKDIRSRIEIPTKAQLADASPGAIKAEQSALRACIDSIRRYNVPNERVFVVLSNDVRERLATQPAYRRNFYNQLAQVLPVASMKIDTTLTASREAELFTVGTIPRKVWPSTSALSIDDNRIIGGYFEANKTFTPLVIPVGPATVIAQAERKKSLNMEAFRREAQRVVDALADSALATRISTNDRGLQQRRTVGVGGDVALAMVSYLYPERADIDAIPLSMDDIDRFKDRALNHYKDLVTPNLSAITDPALRARAEQNLTTVKSRLNEKQLVAGALLLDALSRTYSGKLGAKRFVFVRDSEIGWVTGKFLETISGEYEAAIAKGALYTR